MSPSETDSAGMPEEAARDLRQEIADVLDISIGTVESRLFRARARFKEKLVAQYPEFAQGMNE